MRRIFLAGLMLGIAMAVFAGHSEARDDKKDRVRFYGWVESMPDGLVGPWIVGGQQVEAGPYTEFDELDGPLAVGGCAKVDIRGGAVHEIDSEPVEDCRRAAP